MATKLTGDKLGPLLFDSSAHKASGAPLFLAVFMMFLCAFIVSGYYNVIVFGVEIQGPAFFIIVGIVILYAVIYRSFDNFCIYENGFAKSSIFGYSQIGLDEVDGISFCLREGKDRDNRPINMVNMELTGGDQFTQSKVGCFTQSKRAVKALKELKAKIVAAILKRWANEISMRECAKLNHWITIKSDSLELRIDRYDQEPLKKKVKFKEISGFVYKEDVLHFFKAGEKEPFAELYEDGQNFIPAVLYLADKVDDEIAEALVKVLP